METSPFVHFLLLGSYSSVVLTVFVYCQLSNAGGRLIIASDGIWDALPSEVAAKSCHGLPAELAAVQVVKVINAIVPLSFLSAVIYKQCF